METEIEIYGRKQDGKEIRFELFLDNKIVGYQLTFKELYSFWQESKMYFT